MARFILKRVLILIPTLLAIVFIVFVIMNITPSNPAQVMLGPKATQEAVDQLNHELGIDLPLPVRYVSYIVNLIQGDMGISYTTGRAVFQEIISRFPITVRLAAGAILLAVLIGVPLGIVAAVRQYSFIDIAGTSFAMFMASMPGFWLGLMLILIFAFKLSLLPSFGNDSWVNYILPSFTLAMPVSASILRLTRTTMLESIRQDFVRTARSKGQKERTVVFRHALRNALLPIVTVVGMEFGWLLGGAVVIEQVFSINGVGKLIIESIRMKDVPQVTGCALFLAFFFMLVMLMIDLLYAYIDPRIRDRYRRTASQKG